MRNLIARAVFKELLMLTTAVTLSLSFWGFLIKQLVIFLMTVLSGFRQHQTLPIPPDGIGITAGTSSKQTQFV